MTTTSCSGVKRWDCIKDSCSCWAQFLVRKQLPQEGKHFGEIFAASVSQKEGFKSVWMPKLFKRLLSKTLSNPKPEEAQKPERSEGDNLPLNVEVKTQDPVNKENTEAKQEVQQPAPNSTEKPVPKPQQTRVKGKKPDEKPKEKDGMQKKKDDEISTAARSQASLPP